MSVHHQAVVMIASKSGRLGNRLFQAAHFMANAMRLNYRLLNPSLGEYAHLFEGSLRDPFCGYPQKWRESDSEFASQCREFLYHGAYLLGLTARMGIVPGVRSIDIRHFDETEEGEVDLNGSFFAEVLESEKLILPLGWKFSDHLGISQYRKEIIRYFTPVESVRNPVEAIVCRARSKGDLLVGVHIRQEDYRNWKNGIHFYETEQYARWMRELADGSPGKRMVFLVCASGALDETLFRDLLIVRGPGFPAGDLHALSLCDKIIGPPSTFSTWASYHGGVPLRVLWDSSDSLSSEKTRNKG